MENRPLISVIVPVYNTEKDLRRCLDSIKNQFYENLEIVLINDGSTDGSGTICDEYAHMDSRFKIIHQENQGRTAVRKTGVKASTGEYIGFVDSDDWIDKEMYEHMMKMMLLHNVDMVSTGVVLEFSNYASPEPLYPSGLYEKVDGGFDFGNFYLTNNVPFIYPSMCDKLHKKENLDKFYFSIPNNLKIFEDATYVYSATPFMKKIYISNQYYYHYNRASESSVNNNLDLSYLQDTILMYSYLKEIYISSCVDKELLNQIDKYTLSNIISIMSKVQPNNIIKFMFKDIQMLEDKEKIVIYGAGEVGISYLKQFKKIYNLNNIDIVDFKKAGQEICGKKIKSLNDLNKMEFDIIIIALNNEITANEVHDELIEKYDIIPNKIIWNKPIHIIEFIMGN